MARKVEDGRRADGQKDRPAQTALIFAPKVMSLAGAYLVCDANRNQTKPPGAGVLDGFLDLADADDAGILEYARKWGALCIRSKSISGLRFLEPLSAWRDLAARFRALQKIAAAVNCGTVGSEEDWRTLGVELPAVSKPSDLLTEARFGLMSQMRKLVEVAHLQPRLYWNPDTNQWQIDFDSPSRSNLLAVLILQLMLLVADKEGYAICSGCHRTYIPEKRPAATRRNYCHRTECRKRAAWSDSKREQRRRKRQEND
jgi:hypothetical protein